MPRIVKTLQERLMARVRVEPDGCWVWTAGKISTGYGAMWSDGKQRLAHRLCYELLVGQIPNGLHLDHLCRNRACINPAHLEPVTCRENILRGAGPTAINATRTHCPNGHPYSGDNLLIVLNKGAEFRRCAACRRVSWRKRKSRAKVRP